MAEVTSVGMRFLICALAVGTATGSLSAGTVVYAPETKILRVQSFPEQAPATMDTLLAADQFHGWGVVSYDRGNDTYRVNASVYIGGTDDLGTFVQIGRRDHPRETVIVRGDIWIKPPKKSLKKSDGSGYAIANRLTLGDPADANIQATLKIDCSRPGEFGLLLGSRTKDQWNSGGDLYVFNSTITAATPDKQHIVAGNKKIGDDQAAWYGADIRLVNAQISWLTGLGGLQYQINYQELENTVFEHMSIVLGNGRQRARKCTFRDCGVALAEGGCLSATMIDCVFMNNDYNWTIGGKGCLGGGVTLIDCQVGPQKQPERIQKYDVPLETALRYRMTGFYPACTDFITVPIKVTDQQGKPVRWAAVAVTSPDDAAGVAVRNGYALTDAAGLTPSDPDKSAILIARWRVQATDDPARPKSLSYRYAIAVTATGYKPYQTMLGPGLGLPRPFVVKLEKSRRAGRSK